MLVKHPKTLNARPEVASKIDANIDRVERMIRDLLDTNRIRANERLPLHLAEVDLAALAREVIQDLSPINDKRFILKLSSWYLGRRGTSPRPLEPSCQCSQIWRSRQAGHHYGEAVWPGNANIRAQLRSGDSARKSDVHI
jgi:hypothetical protein